MSDIAATFVSAKRLDIAMKTSRSPKVLFEIRLRRADSVSAIGNNQPMQDELWRPCTPESSRELDHAAEIGSHLFGPRTHWVEKRQA
jgi:hypothetical protein